MLGVYPALAVATGCSSHKAPESPKKSDFTPLCQATFSLGMAGKQIGRSDVRCGFLESLQTSLRES